MNLQSLLSGLLSTREVQAGPVFPETPQRKKQTQRLAGKLSRDLRRQQIPNADALANELLPRGLRAVPQDEIEQINEVRYTSDDPRAIAYTTPARTIVYSNPYGFRDDLYSVFAETGRPDLYSKFVKSKEAPWWKGFLRDQAKEFIKDPRRMEEGYFYVDRPSLTHEVGHVVNMPSWLRDPESMRANNEGIADIYALLRSGLPATLDRQILAIANKTLKLTPWQRSMLGRAIPPNLPFAPKR